LTKDEAVDLLNTVLNQNESLLSAMAEPDDHDSGSQEAGYS
jgi:hypothetical protein